MADENVDFLVSAAKQQFQKGFIPTRQNYFRGPMCGCLVGAAAANAGATNLTAPLEVERLCRETYGVTHLELAQLTEGFDGARDHWVDVGSYPYQQGKELAAQVFRRAAA